MKKTILLTLLGFSLVLLGCIQQTPTKNQSLEKLTKPEAETKSPNKSTEADKVESSTDWQTYSSEEYGFEIQYPTNWKIDKLRSNKETSGSDIVFATDNLATHEGIRVDETDLTLTEWLNDFDKSIILKKSELIVDGQEALRLDISEFSQKIIATRHKNRFYLITTGGKMIENGMLSTLKFIN
ncbi:hypothetical protein KKA33_00435 [Patescibacteria group bacterium]|nr:hypothetical protein [Patescibacteria group bacterium]